MAVFESVYKGIQGKGARVVFPEAQVTEIAEAIGILESKNLAVSVPLSATCDAHVDAIQKVRPKTRENIAKRLLDKPLFKAAAMVAVGEADAMVGGIANPTKAVIEAALMTIGSPEGAVPASFFLMALPDGRAFVFADCAVNVAPDAQALARIGASASAAAQRLLGSGQVGFLSYSTGTSGVGPSVDLVAEATSLAAAAGVPCVGPVQADAALNAAIGQKKGLSGDAPVALVFPSLDAGNIGYKLVQELAGAQAVGPILTGFRRPVADLSRGASADDIVKAAAVALALG